MNRLIAGLGLGLLCFLITGCGGGYGTSEIVDTVPVAGTLTFQGKPLEYYQVVLMPDSGTRVAMGVTDAQGKFKLGTNDGGDGAPPGACKIAVNFVGPPSSEQGGNERIVDDPSKLPKPKIKIPAKYADPTTSGLAETIPAGGLTDLKLELK